MRLILQEGFWFLIYYLVLWSNFSFLRNSQWIIFATHSCQVLYSVCTSLMDSLIMCLIFSVPTPHKPSHAILLRLIYFHVNINWSLWRFFFSAAIWRDSVSILSFAFCRHIKVFSYGLCCFWSLKLVFFLKALLNEVSLLWTPSHRRAKAGRPGRTYIQQLSADTGCSLDDLPRAMDDRDRWRERGQGDPCWRRDMMMINASTLSSILSSPPSSFSSWYIESMWFHSCKALCIFISVLILWSISLNSSLVHFKNGYEYLKNRTTSVFILLMRFLQQSLVSRNFLVLLRFSFIIFSFISAYLMMSASNISEQFYFSSSVLILSLFGSSIPSVIWLFYNSHYEPVTVFYTKFHSNIVTVYSYCLYESFKFFLIFCIQNVIHVNYVIHLFLLFSPNYTKRKCQVKGRHCFQR